MALTFLEFSEQNLLRCNESFHPLQQWNEAEWANAAMGELGEACNMIKKRLRGDVDAPSVEDVAKELADAVTYIDLLAARMEIELSTAVIRKFNEVSRRVKSERRLNYHF